MAPFLLGDAVLKTVEPTVTSINIAAATAALHQVARNKNLKVNSND